MATLRQLTTHLVAFVLLLAGFAATGLWHYLDYFVYRAVYLDSSGGIEPAASLLVIDLPYRANAADNDPTEYRLRLADLLGVIAARERERPLAIVLDIWISNDSRGLPPLRQAIADLRDRVAGPVDVYAAFNPSAGGQRDASSLWNEHAQELYRSELAGYGHTSLDLFMGVLSYETDLAIPATAGATEYIRALPLTVAMALDRRGDLETDETIVLPIGSEDALAARTVAFVHAGDATTGGHFATTRDATAPLDPDFDAKVVLIGSVREDQNLIAPQAGPNLLAWALSDQMRADRDARRPLNSPVIVLGQIFGFALLTALLFALLFKYVPRLQTSPVVTACLAAVASAAVFALAAAAVLALGYVTPVGLTLFAIVLTGILSWHFALTFLVTGTAEGSGKYDVFISYSHAHSEWVRTHIYEPLLAVRKADGSPLSIFFDRTRIGLGDAFTAKYMWAIVDSRFFIPVFSDDYYARNHTRNEMEIAYKRRVEQKIVILPILRSSTPMPAIYSHLTYFDAAADPRFIEELYRAILGGHPLSNDRPTTD